jgi:hypothetical protein
MILVTYCTLPCKLQVTAKYRHNDCGGKISGYKCAGDLSFALNEAFSLTLAIESKLPA